MGVFSEVIEPVLFLCFNPDYENAQEAQMKKMKPKLEYLKDFVGAKSYALGYLTICDFWIAEMIYYF